MDITFLYSQPGKNSEGQHGVGLLTSSFIFTLYLIIQSFES